MTPAGTASRPTLDVLTERVGTIQGQVEDVYTNLHGHGERPGLLERITRIEEQLTALAKRGEDQFAALTEAFEHGARRRLDTVAIWVAAIGVIVGAAVSIWAALYGNDPKATPLDVRVPFSHSHAP